MRIMMKASDIFPDFPKGKSGKRAVKVFKVVAI